MCSDNRLMALTVFFKYSLNTLRIKFDIFCNLGDCEFQRLFFTFVKCRNAILQAACYRNMFIINLFLLAVKGRKQIILPVTGTMSWRREHNLIGQRSLKSKICPRAFHSFVSCNCINEPPQNAMLLPLQDAVMVTGRINACNRRTCFKCYIN